MGYRRPGRIRAALCRFSRRFRPDSLASAPARAHRLRRFSLPVLFRAGRQSAVDRARSIGRAGAAVLAGRPGRFRPSDSMEDGCAGRGCPPLLRRSRRRRVYLLLRGQCLVAGGFRALYGAQAAPRRGRLEPLGAGRAVAQPPVARPVARAALARHRGAPLLPVPLLPAVARLARVLPCPPDPHHGRPAHLRGTR